MHKMIKPNILYFGTPVVLISTLNDDETPNLAPMSSAWWLNQSCMLGMSTGSQTVQNLLREGQCVLNLPSANLVEAVDKLALLTGRNPVPESKKDMYRYEPNKFGTAGLTPIPSHFVNTPRVKECPVHLEAIVEQVHQFASPSSIVAIEVKIVSCHIEEDLLMGGEKHYIHPDTWNPLIMNFCEFFGLSPKLHPSKLAEPFMKKNYRDKKDI